MTPRICSSLKLMLTMEMERRTRDGPPELAAAAAAVALVLDNDDLLIEILLRFDFPTCLIQVAFICKRWLCHTSDPTFLLRFRALHPPRILAFGHRSSGWLPVPQSRELSVAPTRALTALHRSFVCDCRNGRLLVVLEDGHRTRPTTYTIRSLLSLEPDIHLPMTPSAGSNPTSMWPRCYNCKGRLLLLLGDDGDATFVVRLYMVFNSVQYRTKFSILQSGVWGVQHCVVTKLRQSSLQTMIAHKLLVGCKFYMMTTLGYILVLYLDTASFSNVQLPDEVRYSTTLKFLRAQQYGLYIIDVTGFQLRVWHGNGVGQWVLVDSLSVLEACANLDVDQWEPDDDPNEPVVVTMVGDNAEFVILKLVANKVICCMQLSNKVVEKLATRVQFCPYDRSITIVWPPVFPVLDEEKQENLVLKIYLQCSVELPLTLNFDI